jgi:hypothetical protein
MYCYCTKFAYHHFGHGVHPCPVNIYICLMLKVYVYLCISYQGCHCFVTTKFDAVDFCYVCDDVFIWLLYGLGSSVSVVLLYFIVMSLIP